MRERVRRVKEKKSERERVRESFWRGIVCQGLINTERYEVSVVPEYLQESKLGDISLHETQFQVRRVQNMNVERLVKKLLVQVRDSSMNS